ncbi:hypothetical protein [Methylomonas koyamae]|uniref:hypothetical protein n=1 Tax=Methylomonas koyamae TaxID=702114 RepID=UPI000A6EA3FC|nr:hypothetical protein [Methylomonas koyamae]
MKLLQWLKAIAVMSVLTDIGLAASLLSTKNRSDAAMSYMKGRKNLIWMASRPARQTANIIIFFLFMA